MRAMLASVSSRLAPTDSKIADALQRIQELDRQEGIAWGVNSGLDWNEKYALWIESLERIPGEKYGETFELSTPWGTRFKSPSLECAEASVFLRVTFASWYGLPFYLTAWASEGNIHFGHFGVCHTRNGPGWYIYRGSTLIKSSGSSFMMYSHLPKNFF